MTLRWWIEAPDGTVLGPFHTCEEANVALEQYLTGESDD
jgi:hypothetical protein